MAKENVQKVAPKAEVGPAETPEVEQVVDDGLVEVTKDSQTLRVHPTCVKGHLDAGWSK